VRWLAIFLFAAVIFAATKIHLDSKEAHKQADSVLYPLLIAAMNDYGLNHGGVNDPGHLDKIDAKDKKRVEAVREAFKAWDGTIKQAGY
jgi:hypothetical protein